MESVKDEIHSIVSAVLAFMANKLFFTQKPFLTDKMSQTFCRPINIFMESVSDVLHSLVQTVLALLAKNRYAIHIVAKHSYSIGVI